MDMSNYEVVCDLGETSNAANIGKGTKVRCISNDESQSRWGGNDSAKDFLTIGDIYTLDRAPEVHSWHTKYYLEELPGKKFNSVQFEIVK
jgi:hypothetical protein